MPSYPTTRQTRNRRFASITRVQPIPGETGDTPLTTLSESISLEYSGSSTTFLSPNGSGHLAKTVDNLTSNVATRYTRTSRREPSQEHARRSSKETLSETKCHARSPDPRILEEE